jgi:quercetin dioxygenase-like cupin family protein
MALGVGAVLMAGAAVALATPPSGFSATEMARGTIDKAFSVNTEGPSDIVVRIVTIEPGGTTGWHTHPKPHLDVVKAGSVLFYDAEEPNCQPQVVGPGHAFFVPDGHVHLVRNNGPEKVEIHSTSVVPTGEPPRAEADSPSACQD